MDTRQQEANERSGLISSLLSDFSARAAYIKAKVSTIVPSQIRGLRLKSDTPTQPGLASAAMMYQSRISMLETAGANPTIGTLSEIAAALRVGLIVKFVPFSEMLSWENRYSQDSFNVTRLEGDQEFLNPTPAVTATSHLVTPISAPPRNVIADAMIDYYRPSKPVSPIADTSLLNTVTAASTTTGHAMLLTNDSVSQMAHTQVDIDLDEIPYVLLIYQQQEGRANA